MKSIFKKILSIALILALATLCLAACGGGKDPEDPENPENPDNPSTPVVYSLVLEASKTAVSRGDVVTLSSALKAEGKEDIPSEDATYSIVSGNEYASLVGNTLTVLNTAPNGATIQVKAQEGATASNVVTLTVSVGVESIVASAGGATNILAGQSVVLSAAVAPEGAVSAVTWAITEGADSATLSGSVLVVNANAVTGTTVKVQASAGDAVSNELSFTVGYPLESLVISAIGSRNILAGNSAQLSISISPENATNGSYQLVFVNDCSAYATITGNVITVSDDAVTGAEIKVKAVSGSVESNTVTYTVGYPLQSLTAVLLGSANVQPGNTAALSVTLNPTNATNGSYEWQFVEGSEFATLAGDSVTVKSGAAIGSVIKLKAVAGSVESNEVTIVVGTPIETITISSAAPAVLDRNGNYLIAISATPDGASLAGIEWVVSEGADYASVVNSYLVISGSTPAGTTVKLHAASGSITSNELTYTVGVPVESITIAVNGSSNIDPNGSRVISSTINPSNASDTVLTWVIDENSEYATLANGVITVNDNAPIGAVIKFHAEIAGVESNQLSVTVGTPITGIEISVVGGASEIVKGSTVALNATLTPSNASASLITWTVLEGDASIANNLLVISASAATGSKVKIQASFGTVVSNVIEITVKATQAEENEEKLFLDLSTKSVTVDKNGANAPVVSGSIFNANFDTVTNKSIKYEVTAGGQFLAVTYADNKCYFEVLGHGTATVTASIPGTSTKADITVNVILPPERVELPEVFKQRTDIAYAFGMRDDLPFAPVTYGSALACTDVAITFTHTSGAASDEIAEYKDGKITFKKTGKVTAIVSSKSGSLVEATTSYTFDINDGINLHTFEELHYYGEPETTYDGIINIVVLEKPESYNNYPYGYDIVPMSALVDLDAKYADKGDMKTAYIIHEILHSDSAYQTDVAKVVESNRIQFVNENVWLNGNNHKIDASQLRTFTEAEYVEYCTKFNRTVGSPYIGSLFSAEPYSPGTPNKDSDYTRDKERSVRFYNVEVVGNCPVDYAGDVDNENKTGTAYGTYTHGIVIGNIHYTTKYYVDCDNLTVAGFQTGISVNCVVDNGKLTNLTAYNCFASGIMVKKSIVTLENMTIGKCGASAIEVAPEGCNEAGKNHNEPAKVTFAGTIDADENLQSGNSVYFSNYSLMGTPVIDIIAGNLAAYPEALRSHLVNAQGQFNFVALKFYDFAEFPNIKQNTTVVDNAGFGATGMIDIMTVGANMQATGAVDTTHQYITLQVQVTGLGVVGEAIFLNMHYQGN